MIKFITSQQYQKEYYKIRIELGLCISCNNPTHKEGVHCRFHKTYTNNRGKINYHTRKNKVFDGYGNKCACCGEAEKQFLTIDHVNNDGFKDRKSGLTGMKFLTFIIKNNFPKDYQLLCANCNQSKRVNDGICIHQLQEEATCIGFCNV